MKNEDVETAEVAEEPSVEVDAKEAFTKLLAVLGEQDARLNRLDERTDRHDELLIGIQREISLIAKALTGHQRILEEDHPTKPTPPAPPDIVH